VKAAHLFRGGGLRACALRGRRLALSLERHRTTQSQQTY
jgi:hypothetical protein